MPSRLLLTEKLLIQRVDTGKLLIREFVRAFAVRQKNLCDKERILQIRKRVWKLLNSVNPTQFLQVALFVSSKLQRQICPAKLDLYVFVQQLQLVCFRTKHLNSRQSELTTLQERIAHDTRAGMNTEAVSAGRETIGKRAAALRRNWSRSRRAATGDGRGRSAKRNRRRR